MRRKVRSISTRSSPPRRCSAIRPRAREPREHELDRAVVPVAPPEAAVQVGLRRRAAPGGSPPASRVIVIAAVAGERDVVLALGTRRRRYPTRRVCHMSDTNRRFVLRERPTGRIDDTTFQLDPAAGPRDRRGRGARARRVHLGRPDEPHLDRRGADLPAAGRDRRGDARRRDRPRRRVAASRATPRARSSRACSAGRTTRSLSDAAGAFVMPEIPGVLAERVPRRARA